MGDGPDNPWTACAIGLGSNVGDRHAHILAAIDGLKSSPHVRGLRVSKLIQTEPVGPVEQGRYINAAAAFETRLAARALLDALQTLERARGRNRANEARWGPRTLDLDLLVFGGQVIDEPGLRVPHPRLRERPFVLEPLAEIAPDLRVPPDGARVRDLRNGLGPSRP